GSDLDRKVWSTGGARAFVPHKGEVRGLHEVASSSEEPGLSRVDFAEATFLSVLRQTPRQARRNPSTKGISLSYRLRLQLKSCQVSNGQAGATATGYASLAKASFSTVDIVAYAAAWS